MKRSLLYTLLLIVGLCAPGFSQNPFSIMPPSPPAADICVSSATVTCTTYSFLFATNAGEPGVNGALPISWNSSGVLPSNINLSSGGLLSGNPATATAGVFIAFATSSGPNPLGTNRNESIAVNTQPSVTTSSLPIAVQGRAYSTALTAINGTFPFTWSTPATPPARLGSSVVYDPLNSRMIVFGGGTGSTSPCQNDTWVLSNANGVNGSPTWTQLLPSGIAPSRRINHTAVYDSATNQMIVFGGNNCFNEDTGGTFYNDVWVLTNANGLGGTPTWRQLQITGTVPGTRENHTAVYDSATNRMIIFGGTGFRSQNGPFNDVWVLINANGSGGTPTWSQLTPASSPLPTSTATAVYDPSSNRMIMDGSNFTFGTTWILSFANGLGGTPVWNPKLVSATRPSLSGQSAVYDSTSNQMIVFGGNSASGAAVSDTWVLPNANSFAGGDAWTQLSPTGAPPGRAAHGAAFDPSTRQMLIFGGQGTTTNLNDVWNLRLGSTTPAWAQLSPTGAGSLPAGLTVSADGILAGTPTAAPATYNLAIQATDSAGDNSGATTLRPSLSLIVNPPLAIASSATLPPAEVNVPYSFTFVPSGGATGNGTNPIYSWNLNSGSSPPARLTLNAGGQLTGTPAAVGSSTFTVLLNDGSVQVVSQLASLTVNPPPSITAVSLPTGQVGTNYSAPLSATGGIQPYRWAIVGSSAGVNINPTTGVLSAQPNSDGSFPFTVQVTDIVGGSASARLTLNVTQTVSVTVLPPSAPETQPKARISVPSLTGSAITGSATVAFRSDVGKDDGMIGFINGTGTYSCPSATNPNEVCSCPLTNPHCGMAFTIPAGSTTVDAPFISGTTAGTITLNVTSLQSGGTPITPLPTAATLVIPPAAPQIVSPVTATRTPTGFTVTVTGYCTARQITDANFQFLGANLATGSLSPSDVPSKFSDWYQNTSSVASGTAFTYDQSFTISGDPNSVSSVTVILIGPQGQSQAVTAQLPSR